MHDDPLGLNEGAPTAMPPAWKLPHQEPTNLIALWADDQTPTQAEIIAALRSQWSEVEIDEEIDPDDPNIPWAVVLRSSDLAQPAIVWCEPARPLPPGELDDERAEACKWVVGVETQLDPEDPLLSYQQLVRFLATPLPEIVGMLDVNTTGWLKRSVIEEQFLPEDSIPPVEVLWIVHAVAPAAATSSPDGLWLHTHGLWRCGRPELEMLEVDHKYASAAGSLVNEVAERILDEPPPDPGAPFEMGENLTVTLQPWQDIAAHMPDGVPGSGPDREQDDSGMHVGVRAVICDEQPTGAYRKIWSWPRTAVLRLENDEALIWKSHRATERLARQARFTFGELATAFAKLRPCLGPGRAEGALAMVLVKAAFQNESPEAPSEGSEHMWLEALQFQGDRVEGRLLNAPMFITDVRADEVFWIERDRLSDWAVQTEFGTYGPSSIPAMWRAVDQVANGDHDDPS